MLKIAAVVGARPQFIKHAAVSRSIAAVNERAATVAVDDILIHTGQHYDYDMSDVFFAGLGLGDPHFHLQVGSGSHGAQTGQMLQRIEEVLLEERPDVVLVYGDTNSTLAGALAAAKLKFPVAHVEAGLRSYDRWMAEEMNRVLTDHISSWLFCPSHHAVENLKREGIRDGVFDVGDVMLDVLGTFLPSDSEQREIIEAWGLRTGDYAVVTVHRAENVDNSERLTDIFQAIRDVAAGGLTTVALLHPRTRASLESSGLSIQPVRAMAPLPYRQMVALEANAKVVITDSGGVQKEAFWLRTPCVTVRDATEWPETLSSGWNVLVGSDPAKVVAAVQSARPGEHAPPAYGRGGASTTIVEKLLEVHAVDHQASTI